MRRAMVGQSTVRFFHTRPGEPNPALYLCPPTRRPPSMSPRSSIRRSAYL